MNKVSILVAFFTFISVSTSLAIERSELLSYLNNPEEFSLLPRDGYESDYQCEVYEPNGALAELGKTSGKIRLERAENDLRLFTEDRFGFGNLNNFQNSLTINDDQKGAASTSVSHITYSHVKMVQHQGKLVVSFGLFYPWQAKDKSFTWNWLALGRFYVCER